MRGLSGFIFLSIFGTSNQLWASEPNCATAVERLAQIGETISLPGRYRLHANPPALAGKDSQVLWKPNWHSNIQVHEGIAQAGILFDYLGDENAEAAVVLRLNTFQVTEQVDKEHFGEKLLVNSSSSSSARENSPHSLQIDLPRNADGEFIDLNLVEPIFAHLAKYAVYGEGFSFVLNEPSIVEALNQKLNQLLGTMEYQGDRPRRSSLEPEEPLASHYSYDPYQESFFPSIPEEELRDIFRVLEQNLALRVELLQSFLATEFGQALKESGEWDIQIKVEGFSLADELKLEERDLNPFVYRYRVYFRSRW